MVLIVLILEMIPHFRYKETRVYCRDYPGGIHPWPVPFTGASNTLCILSFEIDIALSTLMFFCPKCADIQTQSVGVHFWLPIH